MPPIVLALAWLTATENVAVITGSVFAVDKYRGAV